MFFLSAVQQDIPIQNDLIALAIVVGIILIFAVRVIRKNALAKKAAKNAAQVVVEEVPAPTAPGSAGQLKLHNVEPKTAAMLMAIVADKMGKPLNELRFISIKEVE